MWKKWRPIFGWPHLCPVLFADPLGLVVVMVRAVQPITPEEANEAIGDYYPDVTSETKPEDFGRLKSRVVILDYGLPDRDMVLERRTYYERMATVAT